MAILDPKTRILDVVYTERGRTLLAKEKLKIKYFAFSDSGINYSGSLDFSGTVDGANYIIVVDPTYARLSGTNLENNLHRNLAFESDQRASSDKSEPLNLNSFCFSVSNNSKVLPDLKLDSTDDITLKRTYQTKPKFDVNDLQNYEDVVLTVTKKTMDQETLKINYAERQRRINIFFNNKNNQIATQDLMILSENKVLDFSTGLIVDKHKFKNFKDSRFAGLESIGEDLEYVIGLDEKEIGIQLAEGGQDYDIRNGFLIEVFESGSDGRIKKIDKKNTIDPTTGEIKEEGFEENFFLKVDK